MLYFQNLYNNNLNSINVVPFNQISTKHHKGSSQLCKVSIKADFWSNPFKSLFVIIWNPKPAYPIVQSKQSGKPTQFFSSTQAPGFDKHFNIFAQCNMGQKRSHPDKMKGLITISPPTIFSTLCLGVCCYIVEALTTKVSLNRIIRHSFQTH